MMENDKETTERRQTGVPHIEGDFMQIAPTTQGNVYQVILKGRQHQDGRTLVLTTPRPVALEDAG